ncbi:unnamed protein product, partial [marine sediment metagenome]
PKSLICDLGVTKQAIVQYTAFKGNLPKWG